MTDDEWKKSIEWTRVVVGCVVFSDGRYLLVQEKQQSAYGLWNLPAGHVDKGETLEEAAIREMKEETGYAVELISEIGVYHHIATAPVKHAYEATIIGGVESLQEDEILQVEWFNFETIKAMHEHGKIRSEWVWLAIEEHHDKIRRR